MNSLLEEAYSSAAFRKKGHELVDMLADYLEKAQHDEIQDVFTSFEPARLYEQWSSNIFDFPENDSQDFSAWTKKVINDSIHLHQPGYMGHQVSPVLPEAALADLISAFLNNGVGVFEMGSPTVAMERVVIKQLAGQLGFDKAADGVLTSGGTLGNLTALLAMRQVMADNNAWKEGNGEAKFGVMVSEQAHYCIDRAVRIMGWGEEGIVKTPVDDQFKMDAARLEETHKKATEQGIKIIGAVGSACSTATGSFDPLEPIADFCEAHDLWFHVDAAHGGAAIYSPKYRHLLSGIERADSVIMDYHKMLMCPALVTGLVFKDGSHSYQTFAQKAEYLWAQEDDEWFNLGKRTFECTKDMMALKVYTILNSYGTQLFEENVDRLFELAEIFSEEIAAWDDFELLVEPQCNIVCFRHAPPQVDDPNRHNKQIREHLIKKGQYFIVQTNINSKTYLRTSLMNPFTRTAHLEGLLDEIEKIAADL
jgi:L-2,4-diaminobutyrate decarboxylase